MSFEFDDNMQKTIDLYLNNTMSEEERITFEKKLNNDAILKEEVQLYNALKRSLNEHDWDTANRDINSEAFKTIKKQILSKEYGSISTKIKNVEQHYFDKNKKKKRFYISTVAASVLLFLGLSISIFFNTNTFENSYTEYSNWGELPSYTEKGDHKEIDIENLYHSKQYQAIIKHYEERLNKKETLLPKDQIYLGAAYFKNDNSKKALGVFDDLINDNSLEHSRGYWYKLLIYLKQEDKVATKNMLNSILKNSENYNYNKALELSKKLDLD